MRKQQYDIPATEDVNIGDIRTMANGSKWRVVDMVGLSASIGADGLISKYRLTVVPATATSLKQVARSEQE